MKGQATVDYDRGAVVIELTLEDIAEPGLAIEMVKSVSRALWPDIAFPGEPGFEDDDETPAANAPARPHAARDFSKPPKPGSIGSFVLETAKRLGTTDAVKIADALDLKTAVAATTIWRLKKGGHL